ncbi:sensor domain-containing diguanylate cyclase [Paractinoplanes lichenicola]|uniref:GGDEF domain-containing protein n=1 Tax=Paractinoplanes lichenicola TaxID=2802976 RepID=A0ABS1VLN1_9ACTN|nr:sensor domain-containing diguanylate cyclase [Actinoplanes lichenicola]MBL7255625.1 GGDEF domain-containing protein [Actinoplanes lichenicola]
MRDPARRSDPVMAGLAAVSVAIVLWFLAGPGGATTSWGVQTCLDVLIAVFAWRLVRATAGQRHARRFWRAVLFTGVTCALGDGYQTVLAVVQGANHQPSPIQTGLVVLGMVTVIITMLFHPLGGTGRLRLRLWLDATTVLTAVIVFLWYFVLAEVVTDGDTTELVGAVATSAVMLLITVGLLKLLLSGTAPFDRGPGIVASLGVAGTAIAASTVTLLTGTDDPGVIYAAQLVPCLLMPVGMRYQELRMRRSGAEAVGTGRRRASRLPYVAVGAVQLLLLAALAGRGGDLRVWGVTIGAVAITALVLSRQSAAFTDNERLTDEIDRSREWFRSLLQHSSDVTLVVGRDGSVRFTTPAVHKVLGIEAVELDGTVLADRVHPDDMPTLRELLARLAARPGTEADAQVRLRHTDGSYRWLQVVGVDLSGNPSVNAIVFNARDVTEARALHDELRHQATHDALTGLADRSLLEQRLAELSDGQVSVLLIDLDGFKPINDRHGHHAGDQVLTAVAERLTTWTPEHGLAVRLGGDEFAVLLPGSGATAAADRAEHIAQAVAEPIRLPDGLEVTVGASVGVATGAPGDATQLLKDADAAMYRKKALRSGSPLAPVR